MVHSMPRLPSFKDIQGSRRMWHGYESQGKYGYLLRLAKTTRLIAGVNAQPVVTPSSELGIASCNS